MTEMTTTNRKAELTAEPGKQEITIKRIFDAPRELVFRAHLDADAIQQWWGPAKYKTTIDKLDARPGGTWRFVQAGTDGSEYGFHGVFHDVTSPERIVQTFEFEGMPGHVSLETATFEERDGKTLATFSSVFQSVEDRDGMLQSGMEGGMNEGFNRLDALLESAK